MPVMGVHRTGRRRRWRAPVLAAALVVSVVLVARTHWITRQTGLRAMAGRTTPAVHPASPHPAPVNRPAATGTPTSSRSPVAVAAARLRRMVARHSRGSVSVAAYDVRSGYEITAGATRGMLTASVVKLEFLETLLLRHQRAGTALSDGERAEAQEMIENSDNGAADAIYWEDDAGVGLDAAERPLGLSRARTKPRGDDFWGLSTTSAPEQIALLKDLVLSSSPLLPASRHYALYLMRHVEADECWGVPVVADEGSHFAVKNGWLAIDNDGDRWAVNSDGIVRVDGQLVLMSVMTQHDESMATGVRLVQQFARAAADVLLAAR